MYSQEIDYYEFEICNGINFKRGTKNSTYKQNNLSVPFELKNIKIALNINFNAYFNILAFLKYERVTHLKRYVFGRFVGFLIVIKPNVKCKYHVNMSPGFSLLTYSLIL